VTTDRIGIQPVSDFTEQPRRAHLSLPGRGGKHPQRLWRLVCRRTTGVRRSVHEVDKSVQVRNGPSREEAFPIAGILLEKLIKECGI
jgi:hypothetical protein